MDNAERDRLWERRYQLWDKRDTAGLTPEEEDELRQVDCDIRQEADAQRDAILRYAGCDDTEEEVEGRIAARGE